MRSFGKKLSVVLIVLFVVTIISFNPTQSTVASGPKEVWAFYLGVFDGPALWNVQANVLTDHPLIGNYNSHDPGVAGTQIDQAKGAGIDAFVVSWFGLEDPHITTPTLNNMLDRAAERGFKVGAMVDIFSDSFNRDRGKLVQSLNWLVHDRANHPAYLRYNGKPVIHFAFQNRAGFSTAEWIAIRNEVDPNRTTIWIAEGLNGCCLYGGAMDGMYAFNMAWSNGSAARYQYEQNSVFSQGGSMYIPTIHPGWNEDLIAARDGRPNPTSPRDRAGGAFLTQMWNGAMTINPDVVMVVSWNEYMENSHIEPSQVYGSQALDTLRPLISAWKSQAAAPAPTPTGSTLSTWVNLNVRSGPGTSYARIGTISPGQNWPVTGEQNGWYSISFNGQTGWVSGAYVTVSGSTPTSPPASDPAPAPAPQPTGSTLSTWVNLNVRSGPGTSYARIGTISPGQTWSVTGQQNGWYSINYNGQIGWVSGAYVTVSGSAPASPPSSDPAPAPGTPTGSTLSTWVNLNVRSGPGTSYARIGTISPGQNWPITGEQNGWYAIAYNGQTGWVSGAYVNVTAGSGGAAPAPSGTIPQIITFCTLDGEGGPTFRLYYEVVNATWLEIFGNQMENPVSGTFDVFGHTGEATWWVLDAHNGDQHVSDAILVDPNNLAQTNCQ